ncbi:MAG: hypothetical protein ACOCV2_11185 [Persicimonas sp.]
MDVQEFEQAILKLAFETDARITTASVAYFLGIPSSKANELLNALLDEGVLELDSDREGNLYYQVANQPTGDEKVLPQLRHESDSETDADLGADGPGERSDQPADLSPSVMLVSPNEDDDVDPISPGRRPEGSPGPNRTNDYARLAGRREGVEPSESGYGLGATASGESKPSESFGPPPRRSRVGDDDSNESRRPSSHSSDDVFAGLTRRQARPDASLDRCGASSVIVSDSVRCEPRPLPNQKPVVTSCSDREARRRTQWAEPQSQQSSGELFDRAQAKSTMLAPTAGGELALRQDQLERPEHQPGMALLLSLILCGTGQIYNGEVSKGIMMMVLCFLLWFVLLGWVVHIWSIVDSVVVAERLNRKTG